MAEIKDNRHMVPSMLIMNKRQEGPSIFRSCYGKPLTSSPRVSILPVKKLRSCFGVIARLLTNKILRYGTGKY